YQPVGDGKECRAGVRQRYRTRRPVEKLQANPALQFLDRERERRWGDMKPRGCLRKILRCRNCEKCSELFDRDVTHWRPLSSRGHYAGNKNTCPYNSNRLDRRLSPQISSRIYGVKQNGSCSRCRAAVFRKRRLT